MRNSFTDHWWLISRINVINMQLELLHVRFRPGAAMHLANSTKRSAAISTNIISWRIFIQFINDLDDILKSPGSSKRPAL